MAKDIKIEATGDFPFQFYIEKAEAGGSIELMTIKGVASTVNIDHDNERMSPEALKAMCEVINEKSVPLRVEHQKQDNAIVGSVNKAWVDERNQLWIEADLDKSHPASGILYKSLQEGVKLGLSVGGRVKHAVKEFSEAAGHMVKTFYQVALDEVSVTQRPANYDAWLLAKSIIKSKDEDTTELYRSPFYKDFLFETRGLDYMQSFAKSIPDGSWKQVETLKDNLDKTMTKKDEVKKAEETTEEEKKKSEETTDETKKAAEEETDETKKNSDEKKEEDTEKSANEAFKSYVVKGFETLTNILARMTKAEETETETKKASGSEEETTIMEDKKKNQDSEKEEDETKEKGTYGSEYKMKNMLKRMEDLAKGEATDSETKEKATKDEETTEKSVGTIDDFVEAIEKSLDTLEAGMKEKGKTVLGMREMILDVIRNDSEIQKSMKDMIKQPGFKKSVMMGTPYLSSKSGQKFRLTPVEDSNEELAKSKKDNAGKSFKDVYNTNFSTTAEAQRLRE